MLGLGEPTGEEGHLVGRKRRHKRADHRAGSDQGACNHSRQKLHGHLGYLVIIVGPLIRGCTGNPSSESILIRAIRCLFGNGDTGAERGRRAKKVPSLGWARQVSKMTMTKSAKSPQYPENAVRFTSAATR